VRDDEVIRQATEADLSRVAEIWHENLLEEDPGTPPLREVPSLYLHELETHELFVLERNRQVRAFAALITRGPVSFLADLFGAADHRSKGLGQRLLQHVMPTDGRTCCTVSSNDPRALPLYVRFGMLPRLPNVQLEADLSTLRPPTVDVKVIEEDTDDAEWLRWDTEISGRPRPEDYAYWLHRRGGVPLWFTRLGQVIGYGMAQTRTDTLLHAPDTLTIGPMGARERGDAASCVMAAVHWARDRAAIAHVTLTGPHPALSPLLAAGFRIVEVETFCLNVDEQFADVLRYIPSGGDLW
jgi:GNAT superfamily N-acetyltransferase